jgi:hypothetical protein
MEKKHPFTRTRLPTKGAFELDEVLQTSSLTQVLIVQHTIEVDQIKFPAHLSIGLNQQVCIAHISGVEPGCMKRAQKISQRLQKDASLRPRPLSLVRVPVHVEWDLSHQRFATIPTLAHGTRDTPLEGGQGARDRKSMSLKQLCPVPGATCWRPVPQGIPRPAPGAQKLVFDDNCSGQQR